MSGVISTVGIVGTDGGVPIYDEHAPWKIYNRNEIYEGEQGLGRYVPKIGSFVRDITLSGYIDYIVIALSDELIPTLQRINPSGVLMGDDQADVIFGLGPGQPSDAFRLYFDNSVLPYRIHVDQGLLIGGSMSRYCKIFRGTDVTNPSKIISRIYDQNNNYLTDNIPLELASIITHNNQQLRSVLPAATTADLQAGELVTLVAYNDLGQQVYKRILQVETTGFVPDVNRGVKYIESISLKTPYLSNTTPDTIVMPLNVPVSAMSLMGVVHYNDGSRVELPVDGTKFEMLGIEAYLSTIVGETENISLKYNLGAGEVSLNSVGNNIPAMVRPYKLITTTVESSLSVKLFGYPYWLDTANGYRMKWWLYNLDRNVIFDATPYVKFNDTTGAFDPKLYGTIQEKNVRINLNDVSGTFRSFIHNQTVQILLKRPAGDNLTLWTMGLSGESNLMYGDNLVALATHVNSTNWLINVSANITNSIEWLDKVYKRTFPLFNPRTETEAPMPNYFAIEMNGSVVEYPIEQWNQNLSFNASGISRDKTIFIRFFKRTATTDLQLSVAGMTIRDIT